MPEEGRPSPQVSSGHSQPAGSPVSTELEGGTPWNRSERDEAVWPHSRGLGGKGRRGDAHPGPTPGSREPRGRPRRVSGDGTGMARGMG